MAELPENQGIGSSPVPQPGAPSTPPFQPVAQVQPYAVAPQPAVVPAKSGGSSALKIILIILGIFAFFFLLLVAVLMYGCYKVKKAIHVNSSTGQTSLSVPGMSMNADSGMKFTSSELGTDIYPGAEPKKSGNMRMNIGGTSMVTASFLTSDSADKVVAFYKDKLGSNATSMEFGGTAIVTSKRSEQEQVTVTISQQANQSGGKTQIQIQHATTTQNK